MTLTTERLTLRELLEGDWRAILEYQRNPAYLRYYRWTDRTPQEVRAFLRPFLAQRKERPRLKYQLAITLRPTGRLVGNCGIRVRTAGAREADIGYELDPAYWGAGYATEAATAIVDFGFRDLGMHRIWAQCISENTASIRVLERLGMAPEGRLRENEYFKGRWWDTLIFAVLECEWGAKPRPARAPQGL